MSSFVLLRKTTQINDSILWIQYVFDPLDPINDSILWIQYLFDPLDPINEEISGNNYCCCFVVLLFVVLLRKTKGVKQTFSNKLFQTKEYKSIICLLLFYYVKQHKSMIAHSAIFIARSAINDSTIVCQY